jgi:hypothetical protein
MNFYSLGYLAVLFVVLTPGVLLRLPAGSKLAVAAAHGVVLALVWHFTHRMVDRLEGFQIPDIEAAKAATMKAASMPPAVMAAMPAAAPMDVAAPMHGSCAKKEDCKGGQSCLNGVCVQF